MMIRDQEIARNAARFRQELPRIVSENFTTISDRDTETLDEAYARLTTLEAWKAFILKSSLAAGPLGFYVEAQNDGLTSTVLVSSGLWRSSMKSLRSIIENVIQAIYFMDHPVEYRKWDKGRLRPTFRELFEYLSDHPDVRDLPNTLNSTGNLKSHYKHLSNIVHASSQEFRMTDQINSSTLWKVKSSDVGKWASTQKNVIKDINLVLLCLFREKLQGASNTSLRKSVAICVPPSKDSLVKSKLGVKIIR